MGRADFDAAAPNELPVQAGPARIGAAPDRFGTPPSSATPSLIPARVGPAASSRETSTAKKNCSDTRTPKE
ncbi:hypothetical protein [Streptomyces sp. NPDC001137]|uniref:hypothetical protein n=1 Tax=Streptomyces sp. NPDC001137 TaxID=3154378 RepID=UPI003318BED5